MLSNRFKHPRLPSKASSASTYRDRRLIMPKKSKYTDEQWQAWLATNQAKDDNQIRCKHWNNRQGCTACSRFKGTLGCNQWCAANRRGTDKLCHWCGELADDVAEAALVAAVGPGVVTYSSAAADCPDPPPEPVQPTTAATAPGLNASQEAAHRDLENKLENLELMIGTMMARQDAWEHVVEQTGDYRWFKLDTPGPLRYVRTGL